MTLMFSTRSATSASDLIPGRGRVRGWGKKRPELAQSAMWACTRLRADLISTLPIDTYRKVLGAQIETPKPPVLFAPGGEQVDILEWMYSSNVELDTVGNSFGAITERDGNDLPARIDLVAREDVMVRSEKGKITYWFAGKKQDHANVWHERQFTAAGIAIGLSPLAHAALDLQQYAAAQEFAAAWFGGGLVPMAHLKYSEQKLPPKEVEVIKARFALAIENGEPLVTGKDWEYSPTDVAKAQANFITSMQFSDLQICRYFGVPGDLVDANTAGQSITYANITQRNLQFLILNLGSAITRREKALGKLVVPPTFVKLNSDALLRMDPETIAKMLGQEVRDRILAPSEARQLQNRAPFTEQQIAEFAVLFPSRSTGSATDTDPNKQEQQP